MALTAWLKFAHIVLIFVDRVHIIIVRVNHDPTLVFSLLSFDHLLPPFLLILNLLLDISLPQLLFLALGQSLLSVNEILIPVKILRGLSHRFLKLRLGIRKIYLDSLYRSIFSAERLLVIAM